MWHKTCCHARSEDGQAKRQSVKDLGPFCSGKLNVSPALMTMLHERSGPKDRSSVKRGWKFFTLTMMSDKGWLHLTGAEFDCQVSLLQQ